MHESDKLETAAFEVALDSRSVHEENRAERPQIVSDLLSVRTMLNGIIEAVRVTRPREYSVDRILKPAAHSHDIAFGVKMRREEAEVEGLPETTHVGWFGIEHDFLMYHLVIEEEDATDDIVVHAVILGSRCAWEYGIKIPAAKFTASATPQPRFNRVAPRGATITLHVLNKSTEPRRFRAKIIGVEKATTLDLAVATPVATPVAKSS